MWFGGGKMKKFLIVFALILLCFTSNVVAEDWHDIVIYKLPSFAESQAKSFLSAISSDGAFYQKEGIYIYIVVLSRGYGLDMYEYKLYSLEGKVIISKNDPNYYQWKRLFDNNTSNNYGQNNSNGSTSSNYYSNNRNNYSAKSTNEPYVPKYNYTSPRSGYYRPYMGLAITFAIFSGLSLGTSLALTFIAIEEDQWKGFGEGALATGLVGTALLISSVILKNIERPINNKVSLKNLSITPIKGGMFASIGMGFKGL